MTTERSQQSSQEAHRIHELRSTHAVLQTNDDGDNIAVLMDIEAWRELARLTDGLIEQYKHLENELDDMTGRFCNEAIHLTRAEDRVRELEEQLETADLAAWLLAVDFAPELKIVNPKILKDEYLDRARKKLSNPASTPEAREDDRDDD